MTRPGPAPDPRAELRGRLRRLGERTGERTQNEQGEALGVRRATWSRYLRDGVVPEQAMRMIVHKAKLPEQQQRELLDLAQRAAQVNRPQPVTTGQDNDATPSQDSGNRLWQAARRLPSRSRWLLGSVVALMVAAGVVLGVTRPWDPEQPTAAPVPPAPSKCDRYVVTAESLAIRSEDGKPKIPRDEFRTGQQLTVQRRSADNMYWYVMGDDGRAGWVQPAPDWWRPAC